MNNFLNSFQSVEFNVALAFFVVGALFYGSRSTDVSLKKSFSMALGSFFMAFMVWGSLFTVAWLVLMPFGIDVKLRPFLPHMFHLLIITIVVFYFSYLASKALKIGQ